MRAAVIVILHPGLHPLLRLLEAVELGAPQEVRPDRFPEALDLAQGLRMMRRAAEMMDVILAQFLLEARLAPPTGVLPAIVGEHLLGRAVRRHGPPIDFQHMLRRLAAIQPQPHDVAGVIVQEADQVGILPQQPNRANVALPHLIGCGALEQARLGRLALRFQTRLLDQPFLVQHPPHRLAADRQEPPAPQPLRDLLHPQRWLLALQGGDLLPHSPAPALAVGANHLGRMLQARSAFAAITADPLRQGAGADAQFAHDQVAREPFLQLQLDGLDAQFNGISNSATAARLPPRGQGFLPLLS